MMLLMNRLLPDKASEHQLTTWSSHVYAVAAWLLETECCSDFHDSSTNFVFAW